MTHCDKILSGIALAILVWGSAACDKGGSGTGAVKQAAWEQDADEAVQAFGQKNYKLAAEKFDDAIAGAEKDEATDPKVARVIILRGDLCFEQDKFEESEKFYKQALQWLERTANTGHLDYATALNNLAMAYWRLGRYEEALPLLVQALDIREKREGPDSVIVATSLNNLAGLLKYMERYSEAEPLFLRSLAIKEKTIAPTDMSFARTHNNLAQLYDVQNKLEEAEKHYRKALRVWMANLSAEHEYVRAARESLVSTLQRLGRVEEAEKLATATDFISLLGLDDPTSGALFSADPSLVGPPPPTLPEPPK